MTQDIKPIDVLFHATHIYALVIFVHTPKMESIESLLEDACSKSKIPGAVLAARNKTGSLNYLKAFGVKSVKDGTTMESDTIMTLASCTKLITTVAILQIVENGMVGLDDDVAATLPEIAKLEILTGMKDGKPQLTRRKMPITLRYVENPFEDATLGDRKPDLNQVIYLPTLLA